MYVVRSPQPLTKETANANAATAAISAFTRRASDASLSSAAAAAALKARPTSPTNVADVQSKRLSRRSPSVSSTPGKRRELTRTPSVGSMMERTFRSPSPGRSPAPVTYDVPPIPSIPNNDSYKPSSRPNSSSRKATVGLQTQNFRTASEKMRDGQSGSWYGAATAHDLHAVRRTTSELQLSSIRAPAEARPGSVSPSINFSYPRARLHSPGGSLRSLQLDDQTLVYDPNSRRMVPRAQLEARSQAMYEEECEGVMEEPRAKKRELKEPKAPKQPRISRAGSHLSRGTVGRTSAPALETTQALEPHPGTSTAHQRHLGEEIEPEINTSPTRPKAKKKKKKKQEQASPAGVVGPESAATGTSSSASPNTMTKKLDTTAQSSAIPASALEAEAESPNAMNGTTPSPQRKSKMNTVASREQSESPVRSARFAASADQLVVRHEPPPRSLSPRKSALKHASPTRAVSPSDDGSDILGVPGPLSPLDDARKKSVRVSWDDRNTVVVTEPTVQHSAGQTASSSPQTKKTWHSIVGKASKRDAVSIEKEETMSPRPVLPSFGSVREKKPKEQEERPLVRPEYLVQTETPPAAVAPAASPVEPNTSKPRERLPVIFPSAKRDVEVSSSEEGLMDDTSDEDLDSEAEDHTGANGATAKSNGFQESQVPTIAVMHASPRMPQIEQHENMAPVDMDEDDSSLGSEDLEMADAHAHGAGPLMDDIKEEEEEGDMYSDAYEEIAEPDGDGFLSLDAVLENPTNSPNAKTNGKATPAELEPPPVETMNQSDNPDDWENAKAYWKSLSSEKRRQLEQEAMEEGEEGHHENLKTTETDLQKATEASAQTATPMKDRSYQIAPGTIQPYNSTPESTPTKSELKTNGSSMRKSMREGQRNGVPKAEAQKLGGSLRKSMRPENSVVTDAGALRRPLDDSTSPAAAPRMKRSLRHNSMDLSSPEPRPSRSAADRPASYHAAVDSTSSMKQTRGLRANSSALAASVAQGGGMKTTLRRRGSDSSESSFTRARAGSSGTHEFRRSMRGSMRQVPNTPDSIRPVSPAAGGTRRNSVSSLPSGGGFGAGRLRQSLRGVSADPPARKRMPGFGKSAAGKTKKGKGDSRFGDSSDEDEGPPSMNFFRSRFADSSSEDDEPKAKSKGKGLPKSLRSKSNGRVASSASDLPVARDGRGSPMLDEAVLPQSKQLEAVEGPLHESGSGRGALMSLPQSDGNDRSSHPQHTRRGSFISLLRRKKDPSSKITRGLTESAARQDTKLERSPEELEALRNTPLHKRGPSWPLSQPEETGFEADPHSPERPSTAGGAIVSTSSNKSKFMRRRSASQGMVPADTADVHDDLVADTIPQKKKKFGALRKMFGLHD
ncbi:hypothetical protein IF1G_07945 [Cordyceps javanica]|uniref:Uncharacterized protein n=1 Tax=Cordyceps javanica TaxID=43265 RepID=A0A545UV74_9HYPO|nr:hypothetical protein IF1G_07945 [Cordyceps javanica]